MTEDYAPNYKQVQNNEWPLKKDLDYNNQLSAVLMGVEFYYLDFVLSNGEKSAQCGGLPDECGIDKKSTHNQAVRTVRISYD